MQNLLERLEQLKKQREEWADKGNVNKLAAIEAEIANVQEQIGESEAREQKKEEMLDEYHDTLNTIFDAIMPESVFAEILGVNEYSEKRSDFKKVLTAYYSEKLATINADHAAEIETWRGKLERAADQLREAEQKTEAVKQQAAQAAADHAEQLADKDAEIAAFKAQIAELGQNIEGWKNENEALNREIDEHAARVAELQAKLDAAAKPKDPVQSESLNKVLEEVQSKNKTSADIWIARWEERQKNGGKVKIDHSKVTPPALPFRGETPEVVDKPAEVAFQTNQPRGLQVPDGGTGSGVEGTEVSRAEFEALKADVEAVKKQIAEIKG